MQRGTVGILLASRKNSFTLRRNCKTNPLEKRATSLLLPLPTAPPQAAARASASWAISWTPRSQRRRPKWERRRVRGCRTVSLRCRAGERRWRTITSNSSACPMCAAPWAAHVLERGHAVPATCHSRCCLATIVCRRGAIAALWPPPAASLPACQRASLLGAPALDPAPDGRARCIASAAAAWFIIIWGL